MKTKDFETRMRDGECYHGLRVPPGVFIVLRLDGRAFSALTLRLKLSKPFDEQFHTHMTSTGAAVFEAMHAVYAYTESDEISIVLPRETNLFSREVEKLVSVAAGRASAVMSVLLETIVDFDGRVWVGATEADVVDYMLWRQADAKRCCVNGWAYWTLRHSGKSPGAANSQLSKLNGLAKQKMLLDYGYEVDQLAGWQRHGTGISHEVYTKPGFNPKTGTSVEVERRRVLVDDELPTRGDYSAYLLRILTGCARPNPVAESLMDSEEFQGR